MSRHRDGDPIATMMLRGRACDGKVRHPSKKHALAAGRLTLRTGYTRHGLLLTVYKCGCGSWHLGHSPRRFVTPDTVARSSSATAAEHALADALRLHLDIASRTYDLD